MVVFAFVFLYPFLAVSNGKLGRAQSRHCDSHAMFYSEVLALHSLIRETAKQPLYVTVIYFRVKPFLIIALVIGLTCYREKQKGF